MKFKNYLSWTLDNKVDKFDPWQERYRINIDFVHSLGLKSDPVGWTCFDLSRPDAEELLDKMQAFCEGTNWQLRGGFAQTAVDIESDWYRLYLPYGPDGAYHLDNIISSERDMNLRTYNVTAYKLKNAHLLAMCHSIIASDKFRKVCIANNIPGVDFCWVTAVGKFDSQQYFRMFFTHNITPVTGLRGLQYCEDVNYHAEHEHGEGSYIYDKVHTLGGYLPRLNEMFYDFRIAMQDYFHPDTMPKTGFAYIAEPFSASTDEFFRYEIFVHKDTAEILLREKLISKKLLLPVPITPIIPDGYEKIETIPMGRPKKEYFDAMQAEYEEFIKSHDPSERQPTRMP